MGGSRGRAALDGIGTNLVGGDLLETGAAVSFPGQPEFGRLAVLGEVQQLDVLPDILHDADLTELRALDHPESQIAVDAVAAHDGYKNDAAFAEIAFMPVE